jgi:hypothetical protein
MTRSFVGRLLEDAGPPNLGRLLRQAKFLRTPRIADLILSGNDPNLIHRWLGG